LLETQKGFDDARKALSPDASQLADQLAATKAAKDLADAQKALADAKKAQPKPQSAAFKATIGDVPASGYTGAVDVKPQRAEVEAALLATRARAPKQL